jgi:FMN phosphatase YigB (HAD superfamily)
MNKLWVFDIDNTMANVHHRWDHLRGEKKDWDQFFAKQHLDEPYQAVLDVFHALAFDRGDDAFIVVTGRDERFRDVSLEWLNRHIQFNFPTQDLYMRPGGNREDDDVLKVKIIKNWLQHHPNYKVGAIFEDRHRIIDAFRAEGWYTFECNQERLEY